MKWNCRTLLRACEDVLRREDCVLSLSRIQDCTARNSYDWKDGQARNIRLVVDPAQSSLVEGFLHEALHIVLVNEIGERFNEVLEEQVIRAFEQHLWRHTMRREDTARWRRLINSKLA